MSSGFDRAVFEAALDDVGRLLGDLWAVDRVLALQQEIPEDGFGNGPLAAVGVQVGRHHPFRTSIVPADPVGLVDRSGHAQGVVDVLAREGESWGSAVVDIVRLRTDVIARPPADTFLEAVHEMQVSVVQPIRTQVSDNFAYLSSLSDWSGQAADQFHDYFYSQVEGVRERQALTAEVICFGIAGAKAVVDLGQASVMGLVEAARTALDAQLQLRQQQHDTAGASTSTWIMLAATLAGLVGAVPTGGGSALTAATVATSLANATGTALQFAASVADDSSTATTDFTITSAESAVAELSAGLSRIEGGLDDDWAQLDGKLDLLRAVQESGASGPEGGLWPRRPSLLAGDVTPRDWHHESTPR